MEKKTSSGFIQSFFVLGAGTAINMLLSLVTTPIITRLVEPTENGQFSIFTLYSSVAMVFLMLGMDQSLVRFYYNEDTIDYRRALLRRCLKYPLLITLFVSAVTILSSATNIIPFEFNTPIIVLLCLYTLIQLVLRFGHNIVRLEHNSKKYSLINVLIKATYVAFAIIFLLLIKSHYLELLIIATILSALIGLVYSIICQKEIWTISGEKYKCSISDAELLKFGLPLIVATGIAVLLSAIDKMSLKHYCTYADVGIYTSAIQLVNVFAIIQTTFNVLWAPMAVEHYTKNQDDKTFYQKGNQLITAVMFFLGLSLILCKDLFALLLGEKYREAAYILPFLIFHPIMYTISETTVTGVVIKKKSGMQILIGAVALMANLLGNTILVPIMGSRGAAIATGISYIVFYFMRTLISNRYFYVDYKIGNFIVITVLTTLYALYNTFYTFSWISMIGYIISVGVLFILYKEQFSYAVSYGRSFIMGVKR